MFELAVIMDPIETIHPKKDSTFALLLAAQKRQWKIQYIEPNQLFIEDGVVFAKMCTLQLYDRAKHYFDCLNTDPIIKPLHTCDATLLRKDPPFDMSYLYLTYLLEHAEKNNHLIINKPQSVRDANEKIFASWFPQCCPPTLVSADPNTIKSFLKEHPKAIFKPLDSMGGHLIFLLQQNDPNINVVIETLTQQGERPLMVQAYIPEILKTGDKRILMIDGEPYPHTLIRLPHKEDIRGNLAAGAKSLPGTLSKRDQWICDEIGPVLKEKGLFLVGIDIIGDYLTEINVTSPTGIRHIERFSKTSVSDLILDAIALKAK